MNNANLYINSILSHGAIPLITKPTRIVNNWLNYLFVPLFFDKEFICLW